MVGGQLAEAVPDRDAGVQPESVKRRRRRCGRRHDGRLCDLRCDDVAGGGQPSLSVDRACFGKPPSKDAAVDVRRRALSGE